MRGKGAVVPLESASALLARGATHTEVHALHVAHQDPLLAEATLARDAAPAQGVVVSRHVVRHVRLHVRRHVLQYE